MLKLIPRGESANGTILFELECAPPFGGVDSSAAPPYIDPKNFVDLNGTLITDNSISAVSMDVAFTQGYLNIPSRVGYHVAGAFKIGQWIYEIWVQIPGFGGGNAGNIQVWQNVVNTVSPWSTLGTAACKWDTSVSLSGVFSTTSQFRAGDIVSHKTINDFTYFSILGCDTIFKIGPNASGSPVLAILTTYCGGAFLDELNGHLLVGCVTTTDPSFPAITTTIPYRLAWSAAQNYSQFNPVSAGLVTGAGFNDIPDIADAITGIYTVGPDAYLLRNQGISEMTPLNSGIQPFSFNHLWASEWGMGTMFSNAIGKYGSAAIFIATDDIVSMGYEGIRGITGAAKTFVYENLLLTALLQGQQFPFLDGVLIPQVANNATYLYYVVGTPDVVNNVYRICLCDVDTGSWSRLLVPMPGLSTNEVNTTSMFVGSNDGLFGMSNNVLATFLATYNATTDKSTYFYLNAQDPDSQGQAVFPAVDIMFYNDITIDSVVAYIEATGVGSVAININGVPFTQMITPAGNSAGLYKAYPFNGLDVATGITWNGQPFTGRQPQMTIQITATIAVGKISMFGSYDPKQRNI